MRIPRLRLYLSIGNLVIAEYRGYALALLFRNTIGLAVEMGMIALLWGVIFQYSNAIGGLTYYGMITYYLLQRLIRSSSDAGISARIEHDVLSGNLALYLSKPINYLSYQATYSFVHTSTGLLQNTALFMVIAFVFKLPITCDLGRWLLFAVAIVLSSMLFFELYSAIGLLSFFVGRTDDISRVFNLVLRFIAGVLAPLSIYPSVVEMASSFLPFASIYYYPVMWLIAPRIPQIYVLLWALFWVVLLSVMRRKLWLCGLKKYEAPGG